MATGIAILPDDHTRVQPPHVSSGRKNVARLYLRKRETLTAGIPRLIVEHLDDALRSLRCEECDLKEGVHRARTTCKKVRAILRFVRSAIDDQTYKRYDAGLRDASARLSSLRDAHVQLSVLDHMVEMSPDEKFPAVRAILSQRARAQEERASTGEESIQRAIAELEAARHELKDIEVRQAFSSIEKGLRSTYRDGRRGLRALVSDPTMDNHHEWRKQVKYLRYQSAILTALWPNMMKTMARELRTLSEWLGDARDMALLETALAGDKELQATGGEAERLGAVLKHQRHRIDRKCIPAGERLYADRSRLFVGRIEAWWDTAHPHKTRRGK